MGKGKSQVVGHKWSFGQHLIAALGPVDAFTGLKFGEKLAWEGRIESNEALELNEPELFGASDREGGVVGTVDVMMGAADQPVNDYILENFAVEIDGAMVISAFRQLVSFVFRQVYMGNSPYPPTPVFRLERITTGHDGKPIWYQGKAALENGMNPAHMIVELHQSPTWGLGDVKVNEPQLKKIADTLHNEGFGLNAGWNVQQPVEEFINDILRHIDGYPQANRAGEYGITLSRDDYNPATLPVLQLEIKRIKKMKRTDGHELINELTLVYTDPETGDDATVVVRDAALIQQMGRTAGSKVHFRMVQDAQLAKRIAMRELRKLSTPLLAVELECHPGAGKYLPGDVVRVVFPPVGLDMVGRVVRGRDGTLSSPGISLTLVEDIFANTPDAFAPPPPTGWKPPVSEPVPISTHKLLDAPYWFISQLLPGTTIPEPGSALLTLAKRPSGTDYDYEIYHQEGQNYQSLGKASFTPSTTTRAAVDRHSTSLEVHSLSGLTSLSFPRAALIGDEWVSVEGIEPNATLVVRRGCMDSIPTAHAVGQRLWVPGIDDLGIPNQLFALGLSANIKLVPSGPMGTLPLKDAPQQNISFQGRQGCPLPPANIKIDGKHWPEAVAASESVTISWANRNRLNQIETRLVDWYQGSITPERNQTTVIEVLGTTGPTTYEIAVGETSFDIPHPGGERTQVRVYSQRSGIESFLVFEHSFDWPKNLAK